MSTKKKDPLFRLIKTLTKPEKRHFRLYANRTMGDQQRKFMVLFDLLDKQDTYDEQQLLQKLPGKTTKGRLANLKRHLLKQLLTSLRLTYINKQIDIEIREQLDFARILYSKGLYMESLRLLERIKGIAIDHHQDILHLEIIEFQKLIESRHITRSRQVEKKMERLLEESTLRSRITQTASEMINLNIQIHGYYIVHGFAITPEEVQALNKAWRNMQPEHFNNRFADTFFEKTNRFQSYLWYRYIQLDFKGALSHAMEWVMLFQVHKSMQHKDPDLYMRSLYYLLVFLFLTDDAPTYKRYLKELEKYVAANYPQLNPNSQHVSFVYRGLSHFNYYFLRGDYRAALKFAKELSTDLQKHRPLMDEHRVLLFYYKSAAAAFGSKAYEEALVYLHPILHQRDKPLRKDLEINARLLELLCLFETEEFDRMSYRLISFGRSVVKAKEVTPLQREAHKMLRALIQLTPEDTQRFFKSQLKTFKKGLKEPRELLFLKYLNLVEWMEEKV